MRGSSRRVFGRIAGGAIADGCLECEERRCLRALQSGWAAVCLLCVPALCDAFVRVIGQAISQTSWCGTVPPGSRCVGRPDRSMMVSSIFSPIAW